MPELKAWLQFLENRHPKEINLGLSRVFAAAISLDLLHPTAFVITVAGTNGKGSTVAILESLYSKAGYAVGAYTSPHLLCFNERIRINQKLISDIELCTAFETIQKEAVGFTDLSYFEVTTLAALWHFKQHSLDLIILEVGLGGRLDAVNCIDADLAIITTIAKDHEAYLGDTIEAIAYEKAGILRANRPFMYADNSMPHAILKEAGRLKAIPLRQGIEYWYKLEADRIFLSSKNWLLSGRSFAQKRAQDDVPHAPLTSYHPNSQAAALFASYYLQNRLPLTASQREEGMRSVFLAGRQQYLSLKKYGKDLKVVLDVAHNPQSCAYLAKYLTENYPETRIHAVFSAFEDKDIEAMITCLKHLIHAWYLALLPSKRAASASQLMDALKACGQKSDLCYHDPVLAFKTAVLQSKDNDLLLVFGSFVTVGLVFEEIQ